MNRHVNASLGNSLSLRICTWVIILIVLAELIASAIWVSSIKTSRTREIDKVITDVTLAAVKTVTYFRSLPDNYRHLVLSQMLETGGSRFFISLNNQHVVNQSSYAHESSALAARYAHDQLQQQLGTMKTVVTIASRDDVRLFNTGLKLDEVPSLWTQYSMVLGDFNLPIIVIQLELARHEWLYLATTLPIPYTYFSTSVMEPRQYLFLIIASVLLLGFITRVIRHELSPLRALVRSAALMSSQLSVDEIPERGAGELRTSVRAFNKMNRRISNYIHERELLFSTLSHDLRTPLACLKLRAEMLDDDPTRARFEKLLNDMDFMLKNALQCIRDTDLHEELESFDLVTLIQRCADEYNLETLRIKLHFPPISLPCMAKPLAMRRCLMNVIDNGIKYGERLSISVQIESSSYRIEIHDAGPGIAAAWLERVFEPYTRVRPELGYGSGLGLTIARSIARAHGGDLVLRNHAEGGLVANITLERGL